MLTDDSDNLPVAMVPSQERAEHSSGAENQRKRSETLGYPKFFAGDAGGILPGHGALAGAAQTLNGGRE